MNGSIHIISSGYDPECGKHVKDPYLGRNPTLGGCRPDIRKRVNVGDYIFAVSGKVESVPQFVMGGFEVARKVDALTAYSLYPELRLHRRRDGQVDGNVIVDALGRKSRLDGHKAATFKQRTQNYIIGTNPVVLVTREEIVRGREETLETLRRIFDKPGASLFEIVGHYGKPLREAQVRALVDWLCEIKKYWRMSA
jgi:hypothetical protein